MAPRKKLRSLEIFSGAGGMALATERAGFSHDALIEWNKDACNTLRENSSRVAAQEKGWRVIEGDVREVDFREFEGLDLVAGGPPCQPFSIGGKHHGNEDLRDMIPEFIRAVRQVRPKAFIMENVRGLTRQSFKNYFSYTVLQLSYPTVLRKITESWESHLGRLESFHTQGTFGDLHYNVNYRVLNSANYGVAQTRERVFVVGFRSDIGANWHFPDPTHSQEELLYQQWVSGEYWDRHKLRQPPEPCGYKLRAAKRESVFSTNVKSWITVRDALAGLPQPKITGSKLFDNHRLQTGARSYAGHTGSPIDWPSKTLKAGDHGVPGGENMILFPNGEVRYFSVREAARIQAFPDNWYFGGAWTEAMRQLGNAVPVGLAQVVAESVAQELRKRKNG